MKRKKLDEIINEVEELMRMVEFEKSTECDPEDRDYVKCVLVKARIRVEIRKRLDKLLWQLAFQYVSSSDIMEKEEIENMVGAIRQLGYISEERWVKAVTTAVRFIKRLDGELPVRSVKRLNIDEGMI